MCMRQATCVHTYMAFYNYVERERSKIALAYAQSSPPATLPTLVYGPMSRTSFWVPGSPSIHTCVEKIRDEARL